jgi:hypothetical protein
MYGINSSGQMNRGGHLAWELDAGLITYRREGSDFGVTR